MAELADVIVYISKHYPHQWELSKARLTKLLYLADWRSAITRGRQLTDTRWTFNYYGPYVKDVIETARVDPRLLVVSTTNSYGNPKELIRIADGVPDPPLTTEEKDILQFVIEGTADMGWDAFISLVYSTYPIITQYRFSDLDLEGLAKEYNQQQLQG